MFKFAAQRLHRQCKMSGPAVRSGVVHVHTVKQVVALIYAGLTTRVACVDH